MRQAGLILALAGLCSAAPASAAGVDPMPGAPDPQPGEGRGDGQRVDRPRERILHHGGGDLLAHLPVELDPVDVPPGHSTPLDVICPQCNAAIGVACRRTGRWAHHLARAQALEQLGNTRASSGE